MILLSSSVVPQHCLVLVEPCRRPCHRCPTTNRRHHRPRGGPGGRAGCPPPQTEANFRSTFRARAGAPELT